MTFRSLVPIAALFAATSLLSGCLNSDDSPGTIAAGSEEEAIQNVMFEEMGEYIDPDVRYTDDGSGAARAPIATERWRREVQRFARNVTIEIESGSDTRPSASVQIEGEATGLLHLWAQDGDAWIEYVKDFDDTGVRSLYFERVRAHTPRHRGWKLQALSGVEIASEGTSRRIQSIRIQAGDVDETITGVSELIAVEDLLRIPAGPVTITVDTGDASDQVFLHLRHRFRKELTSNEDGTFSGEFETDGRRGPRHLVVDVLSDATLNDDQAPYDNVAWGYPFVIEGQHDLPGDGSGDGNDAS